MTRALRPRSCALPFHCRRRLGASVLLLVTFASGTAFAQRPTLPQDSTPSTAPKTREQLEAQEHFQRAKDLYSAGSYREAVSELEAARLLDPKAKDLVFNLGIVHEKLGKFDEAIAFFQKYEEMEGVTAGERAKAENVIKRIEGAKRELAAKPAAVPGARPPTDTPAAPVEEPRGRLDGATIAVGGVAVVGLAVGATFGIVALARKPSSSFVTGHDGSYADLQSKTDSAHTFAIVSDIGLGVGIVAAAVTAYLFFGRTKDPSKTGLATLPLSYAAVHGGGAVLLGGSFR